MEKTEYEKLKEYLLSKGYRIFEETEDGCSFINDKIEYCALMIKEFFKEDKNSSDKTLGLELRSNLEKEVIFTKKMIAIILNSDKNKETLNRDSYWFSKITPEQKNIIPFEQKDVVVSFKPMKSIDDVGDFNFDIFDYADGLPVIKFLLFLSQVNKDFTVKYPKIMNDDLCYYRYLAKTLCREVVFER